MHDLYPEINALKTSTNPDNFDETCSKIINIIVSYDMGWSKRGNGRSYDSLNEYGTIIGFLSKKVLDYATRNRQCNRCDKNQIQLQTMIAEKTLRAALNPWKPMRGLN